MHDADHGRVVLRGERCKRAEDRTGMLILVRIELRRDVGDDEDLQHQESGLVLGHRLVQRGEVVEAEVRVLPDQERRSRSAPAARRRGTIVCECASSAVAITTSNGFALDISVKLTASGAGGEFQNEVRLAEPANSGDHGEGVHRDIRRHQERRPLDRHIGGTDQETVANGIFTSQDLVDEIGGPVASHRRLPGMSLR